MIRRWTGRAAAAVRGAVMVAAVVVAPGAARAGDFTLTILHTNDLHARIDEVTAGASTCQAGDRAAGRCLGGVARLAGAIAALRAREPNPIVLDAGDRFQGSLFYRVYKGSVIKAFTGLIGYDALGLGNHEFDDGPEELARFLQGLSVPVLAANLVTAAEPRLDGRIAGSAVVRVGGEPVGVIGLITPQTAFNSHPGATLGFTEPTAALRREVAALTAQGITRIIAVTHLGFAEDRALAAAVDDVDVYVGGHSHTLLHNSDPAADGPSPVVVRQPSGRPSLIVQTGFGGRYLGRLQVSFDAQGVPVRWQGEPLALDRAVAADPTALAFVEALAQPLAAFHREPVATATVALEGGRQACRAGECLLGDLIAEALLWSTRSQGTRVAILNGGGIRASLPAGPITVGQILEVLPFSNTIATLELTGADLRAALEFGVARAEDQGNDGTGRFPQVAGLRFVWDAAAPAGQRIVSVTVAGADGSAQPLDPAAVYEVATHDYLRQGGDGYTIFRDRARNPYDGGATLEDAFAAYLSAHDPVAPALDGRIRRLN